MVFLEEVKKYKKALDEELESCFCDTTCGYDGTINKQVADNLKSFVLNGGKRLRPIALIKSFSGLGGDKNILRPSLCVELMHNATLVHDDIMDQDDMRRGEETFHKRMQKSSKNKRFGEDMGILGGNILLSMALSTIQNSEFSEQSKNLASKIFNNTYLILNQGQIQDISFEMRKSVTEDEYLKMAEGKTSALFEASMKIGAVFSKATNEQLTYVEEYAKNAASAFQIRDDVMTLEEPEEVTGKKQGNDIMENKKTLLLIKALEFSNENQKKIIQKSLGNKNATKEEINQAIDVFKDTGAIDYIKDFCEQLVEKALENLKNVGYTKESEEFFKEFAYYLIKRRY